MDKKVKISGIVTVVLGCISFSWLIYDIVAFHFIRPKTLNGYTLGALEETLGMFVWLGYLVIFVFHISAFLTLILLLQHSKKANILTGITLFLCILSLFFLMGDYSMLNDIGKESKIGTEVEGEWFLLYMITILHGIFHIAVFSTIFAFFRNIKNQRNPEFVFKEEILFVTAQFIGLFCGAIGLWTNFSFMAREIKPNNYADILPFFILCFLPYGLTAFFWLTKRLRDKPADWYDEKQWQDISKSALATLVLSIPGMAVLFFIAHPLGMFWFTHYLFLCLFLFSGCTIYFSLGIGQIKDSDDH
ncbi:MAG: hypothetical protein MUP98_17490 [Candidatus Aminicenantes bacterium]|nr:hypothetical protein [Candidatus Aminicenantes bacterium]